jgi:hypothetical protein
MREMLGVKYHEFSLLKQASNILLKENMTFKCQFQYVYF